ncbi:MAG TPA: hypothetical protein VEV13_03695, partial [Candidatus Limnocylindria bacterium]|nr:hypothetical protein [Candidatus Limnocylindria bacterium]
LEAVGLFRELGEVNLHAGYCHAVAAGIAEHSGDISTAATLIGVWDFIVGSVGGPVDPLDAALRTTLLAQVPSGLRENRAPVQARPTEVLGVEAAADLVESVARAASEKRDT